MTGNLLERHRFISESKRTPKVPGIWEGEYYYTPYEGPGLSLFIFRSSSSNTVAGKL